MKCKIYKIFNDIDNKLYIGKTTCDLRKRFSWHIAESRRERAKHRPLYVAINNYGIDHFFIEQIEECDNTIGDEREEFWIAYYDSYYNGYNSTLGGKGKSYYLSNKIEELIDLRFTYDDIKETIGCSYDTIKDVACKSGKQVKRNPNDLQKNMENSKIIVYQYSKSGKQLNVFNSLADAARWLLNKGIIKNCSNLSGVRGHISEVCRGKRKSAYGYCWKFF